MDLERVKKGNLIEDIVGSEYPLRGRGRYLRAENHDSLVVDTHGQAYFWNSQGEQGDVITWVMHRRKCEFKAAIEWLCTQAGLPAPQWGTEDAQAASERRARYDALTIAARHFVRLLRQTPLALEYCKSRGWIEETIQQAGLGYADGDVQALRGEFTMHEVDTSAPAAQAAMKISGGMLIYPHVEAGRVVYVSARAITEKRHYNPPVDLVGERRVYCNWCYSPREDTVVLVEGQADAVTLGQWEIPAIALAGVAAGQELLKTLARHERVYLGLNQDQAGIMATRNIADVLGPLTRLVTWPAKDANEWLQGKATAEDCAPLLAAAPTWVETLAREAGQTTDRERIERLRHTFAQVARLDEFTQAAMRQKLAETMGLGLREFTTMFKATLGEPDAQKGHDGPLITVTTVGGMIENAEGYYLVEALYTPPKEAAGAITITSGETRLAIREPNGNIRVGRHLDVGDTRYMPPPGDSVMLRKQVVSLAEDIGPLLTSRELVQEVVTVIRRYVDLDPFFEYLSSYYVVFTWLFDCFTVLPYLRFQGDYGTGKSRALQVIGGLCFRPIRASGAATVSPIFRMLDTWRGTLLLEESDYSASDYASDIIKILNSGFDRMQGIVLRSGDRDSGFEPEVFEVFGPKILAMRGEFIDRALSSRCLTKEMGAPTLRNDIPEILPGEFWLEEVPRLRGLLLRYRFAHWQPQIAIDRTIADPAIEARLNQITLALYSVVDDDGLRQDLRAFVQNYHRQLIEERGETKAARVLEALVVQVEIERVKPDAEMWDLRIDTIRLLTNELMDFENNGGDAREVAIMQKDYDPPKPNTKRDTKYGISARSVGEILRRKLQLQTIQRTTDPTRQRHVVYDAARVETLCRRYGIDDDLKVNLLAIVHSIKAAKEELRAETEAQLQLNL